MRTHSRVAWVLTSIAATLFAAQGAPLAQTVAVEAAPAVPVVSAAELESLPEAKPVFAQEQIEQMVAPIALYPDALLAQVFMSATYPLEIVQAARWLKKNPDLKDEALDSALREETWDPSVKTMVMFPTVLQRMNDNLDWTQDLGDAFLAQETDVMGAVQRLRKQAQQTGALKDTPQQKVVVEKESIIVETADPQVVYVPSYNPTQVYGTPAPTTQYYPTVYQQPVYTTATTTTTDSLLTFGAGALAGGLLTAAIMWDDDDDDWYDGWGYRHHVWNHGPGYWDNDWRGPRYGSDRWRNWDRDIDINAGGDVCIGRCTNIDRNEWKKQARTFEHNPVHRGGVRYKDVTNTAARHPGVAKTLPAKLDQRPGRPGRPGIGGGGGDRPAFKPRPPDRPDLARPDRPAIATRPALRPDRPGAGGGDRPGIATRPAERPKPATRPAKRPEPGIAMRPAERPKPATRPAQRPATREARPAQQVKPATRDVSRVPQTKKGTAFQSRDSARIDRAASQRGAASRGKATAQARPQPQFKAPTRSVNRAPQAKKGNAFQSRASSGMERKASSRGAASRGKASRGGGGGHRGGGKRGR